MGKIILSLIVVLSLGQLQAQTASQIPTTEELQSMQNERELLASQKEPDFQAQYERCAKPCGQGGPCPFDTKKKCRIRVNRRKEAYGNKKCAAIADPFEKNKCLIIHKNDVAQMRDSENMDDDTEDDMKRCNKMGDMRGWSDEQKMECSKNTKGGKAIEARGRERNRKMVQDLQKNTLEQMKAQMKGAGVSTSGSEPRGGSGSGSTQKYNTYKSGGSGSVNYGSPSSGKTYPSGSNAGTPTYK